MARRGRGEETPGQKAERERLERLRESERQLAAQRRKESHQKQQERIKATREARKAQEERDRRAAASRGGPGPAQPGRNEAAVIEYLRRNPNATTKDVAFRAIYGGGTVAWEGLHSKTRKQAEAEASKVLARLKARGDVRQAGWTGGGRPKWDITAKAPDTPEDKLFGWFGTKPSGKGKGRGKDEPEPEPGLGLFRSATGGSEDSSDQGGDKGLGIFRAPGDDDNGGDDDDGGGAGIFRPGW